MKIKENISEFLKAVRGLINKSNFLPNDKFALLTNFLSFFSGFINKRFPRE